MESKDFLILILIGVVFFGAFYIFFYDSDSKSESLGQTIQSNQDTESSLSNEKTREWDCVPKTKQIALDFCTTESECWDYMEQQGNPGDFEDYLKEFEVEINCISDNCIAEVTGCFDSPSVGEVIASGY